MLDSASEVEWQLDLPTGFRQKSPLFGAQITEK
jgi:hypothetical protein